MSEPREDGRIVRLASGEIEMCLAQAKRQVWAAHSAMIESLTSTDPLEYHKQMKVAMKALIKAQADIDAAQTLARNIQDIAIARAASQRGKYRKEKE